MDGAVADAASDGDGDGEVGGGFVYLEAADDVGEDVFVVEGEVDAAGEDGGEEEEAVVVYAVGGAAGVGEGGGGGEGLDFDEEGAGAFDGDGDGGAGGVDLSFGEEGFGGVGDFDHALFDHFEDADFAGGSEAVFDGAEEAVFVEGVAFEVEDGVYDVFEDAGAGDGAFFGDVADEEEGGAGAFCHFLEAAGAFAYLADAAGGGFEVVGVGGLDGVYDDEDGVYFFDVFGHDGEVGFGDEEEVVGVEAEAVGAHFDLADAFFAGDVEGGAVGVGDEGGDFDEEGGFADAGFAADEDEGAGDDAAAEDAGEFFVGEGEAREAVGGDFGEALGEAGGGEGGGAAFGGGGFWGGGDDLFDHCAEFAALGAFADVAGGDAAAGLADVLGVCFSHGVP